MGGITLTVKTPTGWRKRLALCAYGITPQGQREWLSIRHAKAKAIFYQAATQRAAVQIFRRWADRWRAAVPGAVACLEKDIEELLAFFTCPAAQL